MIANVLSIAGSDPSGGAGIQADLKAFAARGVYGMAALTALTVQNTQGVTGVELPPPDFVERQIDAVFTDIRVDAIKVGMIASAQTAHAVARALKRYLGPPIVLDPVMVAKGGAKLLDLPAVQAIRSDLIPIATVITPNLLEAASLLGAPPAQDRQSMTSQAEALLMLGARAVLLKGGHLPGEESPDLLMTVDETVWLEARRIETPNTHGTGCTLSSALAAELAKGAPLAQAALAAKTYLAGAIRSADALSVGSGHGPVNHFHQLWRAS